MIQKKINEEGIDSSQAKDRSEFVSSQNCNWLIKL